MSRKRYWLGVCVVAGIAAAAAVLYFVDPATTSAMPPCPFHYMTGLHCPGCGSLRATHQLLHGNILTAIRLNPLMVASLPVLVLFILRPSASRRPWVAWLIFAVIVAFWLLRNVPFWLFVPLAPHTVP